ncbi:hypothetical protein [Christiangramia portivictoriae]|uniref:hypothetical protein n=1 Tax=Christiangramia portivictoriae TaxID=326069 RepID=UPI0003F62EBB|nr:hypothetical protein [Christiangramia portivictoriae]
MFKLIKISFLSLLFIAFTACDEKKKEEKPSEEKETLSTANSMKTNMQASSDLKYNPAHGVEGHRCELPVGAPLTSEGNTTAQPMTTSPVRMQSATPKINPPHGQPGHDCSVAVGAELN